MATTLDVPVGPKKEKAKRRSRRGNPSTAENIRFFVGKPCRNKEAPQLEREVASEAEGLVAAFKKKQIVVNAALQKLLLAILIIFVFQLIYGGFMAGIKAAVVAPTWPDINGQFIPKGINELSPAIKNIFYNSLAIHFIHRGLAYLLFAAVFFWWTKSKAVQDNKLFSKLRLGFVLLITVQIVLGILSLLNATYTNRLVWLGVSHQFTAMLLLMLITALLFVVRKNRAML